MKKKRWKRGGNVLREGTVTSRHLALQDDSIVGHIYLSYLQVTLCKESLDLLIPHYSHGYNHSAARHLQHRPVYDTARVACKDNKEEVDKGRK